MNDPTNRGTPGYSQRTAGALQHVLDNLEISYTDHERDILNDSIFSEANLDLDAVWQTKHHMWSLMVEGLLIDILRFAPEESNILNFRPLKVWGVSYLVVLIDAQMKTGTTSTDDPLSV